MKDLQLIRAVEAARPWATALNILAQLPPGTSLGSVQLPPGTSLGSVHVGLARLEEQGLVRTEQGPGGPERGHRPRRFFYLTRQGLARLVDGDEPYWWGWIGLVLFALFLLLVAVAAWDWPR